MTNRKIYAIVPAAIGEGPGKEKKYLNPVSNGSLGICYLNTTTPDGYKVDENGAWIQ